MIEEGQPTKVEEPVEQVQDTVLESDFIDSIDEAEHRHIVSFVVDKYNQWADDRDGYEERWEVFYNNYRQRLPKQYKWRSRIFDPATFQQVESILSRLVTTLVPDNDFFEVRAKDPNGVENESLIKSLLQHQLENAQFFTKLAEALKQMLIYGTTFIKIPFREEWGKRRDKIVEFREVTNPLTGETIREKAKKTVITERVPTFYGPDIEVVDIFDIFADPRDPELSECIHVTRKPMAYLIDRAKEGHFRNVHLVKPDGGKEGQDATDDTGVFRDHDNGIDGVDEDLVTLKEYWGFYDLEGNGETEPVTFTIANDSVLLRAEPNPYWHGKAPFVWAQFIPVPKELYGIGIPESIQTLQGQINEVINQRNDNIALILNRMWLVSSLVDIDLNRLKSVPGRFIMASDINGVKPLDTPDVTASSYNEVALLKNQVEEATGFSRFAAGLEQGRTTPRAARTVMAFQQASLAKFGLTVRYVERMLVTPILEQFLELDQQFLDDTEYIRITRNEKPEMMEVDPSHLRGNYTFQPLGASEMMNDENKLQGLLTFLTVVQQDPSVDRGPIIEKIWRLLGNRDALPLTGGAGPVPGAETLQGQLQNSGVLEPPTQPLPGGGLF